MDLPTVSGSSLRMDKLCVGPTMSQNINHAHGEKQKTAMIFCTDCKV